MAPLPAGLAQGRDPFRRVHVGALALCAIMLPWSKALLSLSLLLLVANWLVEGLVRRDLGPRFRRAFTHAPSLVFISFLALHIVGLLWTTDLEWGMDLVRILAPVLALGAVLGTAPHLRRNELRAILLLGAWSVVASTVACLLLRHGATADYRALSVFISHIRLSLLLCMAVAVFLLDREGGLLLRTAGYLSAAWAVFFMDRLGSIQGYVILATIAAVFLWRWAGECRPVIKGVLRTVLVAIPLLAMVVLVGLVRNSYRLPDPAILPKFERTAGGEYYQHDIHNPQMENGNHVWMYVAMDELERGWSRRSERAFDSKDDKGHFIWGTLVRYMASKGLRKDSVSLRALSDADIRAVERGVVNAHPTAWGGLGARINEVLFELEQYHAMGTLDGHSVAMRLEFLRVGWRIARNNWLVGVGTGDTQLAFDRAYMAMGSDLAPQWRHRAHNQYLTLWISFGVLGLVWSLFSWWWPAYRTAAWRQPLFIAWAIIFGISCLSDDTIETQVGATFFVFYYALFVFTAPDRGTVRPTEAGHTSVPA